MPRSALPSFARSALPRVAIVAAALVLALHAWVVSWGRIAENVLLPSLATVWLCASFWGWGALLARARVFGGAREPRGGARELDAPSTFALGIAASIAVVFVLGAVGALHPTVFRATTAIAVVLGLWLRPPWRKPSDAPPRDASPREEAARDDSRSEVLARAALWGAFGAWLVIVTVLAFLPELDWDAQAYHLATAKIYVREGRILAIPWLFHSNFPIAADLVFLQGLLLGSEPSTVLLALVLGLCAVAAVHRLARRFLPAQASVACALLFALSPDVAKSIDACLVELAWTAFAVLALAHALEWDPRARGAEHHVRLAALFAGFSAGIKLPGIGTALAVGAIVLVRASRARRAADASSHTARRTLAPALAYAWIAGLAASPCYVKSWIQTGTPVWPLSLGVFDVRHWSDEAQRRFVEFSRAEWAPLSVGSTGESLRALGRMLVDPSELTLIVTVLASVAAALAALDPRGRRALRELAPLALFALPHAAFWCLVSQQSRFLLPVLPAALVTLLVVLRPATSGASFLSCAAPGALACALAVSALPAWIPKLTQLGRTGLPIARGAIARGEVLAQSPYHRLCATANELLPSDARVLLFQEIRGYWLDRDYMWGDTINQAVLDYRKVAGADALRARLAELGITHVLYGPFRQSDRYCDYATMAMVEDVLATSRRVASEPGWELFELGSPPTDDRARVAASSRASDAFAAAGAMDGRADLRAWNQGGGWMSGRDPTEAEPEELAIFYPRARPLRRVRVVSHPDPRLAIASFVLRYERDGKWIDVPNTDVRGTAPRSEWKLEFEPISARRWKLVVRAAGGGAARVLEITPE